jgi:hypothetical protein
VYRAKVRAPPAIAGWSAGPDGRASGRYGSAAGETAAVAAGGIHGFVPALTSFAGRADQVDEVAGLMDEYRL